MRRAGADQRKRTTRAAARSAKSRRVGADPPQALCLKKARLTGRPIASALTVTTALMVLFGVGQMFGYKTASPYFRKQ
jgi:hypothetical protein